MLMVSMGHKRDGSKKDTWKNIEARHHCVVHIANTGLMHDLNETARGLAAGESELDNIEHQLVAEEGFALPRMKAAPIAMACRHHDIHLVGEGPQAVIYLAVKHIYVNDSLLTDPPFTIDSASLDPLSRLGGENYASLGAISTIKRPA
jgi:flavin reductase (DIM6/NTAB) family NADH-FMN oxidoreductase RutF